MTDKPKFRVGDIVGTRSNPGYEYEVAAVHGPDTVDVKVLKGEYANGHIYYAVGTEPLHLLRPAQDGLTILDAEGRAALKAGDRVLVECTVQKATPDSDGDLELSSSGGDGSFSCYIYTKPESVYAKLPAAETKKEIAVGDFVSILRRTGSKGKVLAFMSNGHAVVEYAAGDDFNVSHYDVSCLELI